MDTLITRTSKEDQQIALSSLKEFNVISKRVAAYKRNYVKIKVQETKDFITIPKGALILLSSIIKNMADGKAISIVPSNSEVTTQQAAEILNVSRPHLIKLLESGKLPFKKVGSHRRVLLIDLTSYMKSLKTIRDKQLDFLASQAQDLNLGYE